ncbi:MAG: hypothetical protein WCB94_13225, partial [Terriglobales bacterium]
VEADQILPLLDGLDEVKPAHRATCVEAINAFRKAHDLPLAICSRTADYQALDVPLQLDGAIIVQPLSPQQVDSYLTEIGTAGAAVKRAMDHDPMLREMLDSPLMLNIVTVAHADQPESQPRLSGTLKERRDHLFGAYVDQMFRRRGIVRRYTPQRTVHWLKWLAWQMVRHSQTVFYIERLQLDWLPGEKRWAFVLFYGLVFGLFGGLVFGLVRGLFIGLIFGLFGGQHAGGQACLMHLALRLWLVLDGSIPWNYVKFLDYAAERILLRKVGGGYIFIHRMLLEYFAARYDKSAVEATPNAEPSQIAIEM